MGGGGPGQTAASEKAANVRTGVRVTSLNELSDTAYTQPIAEVRCGLGPELSGVYATEEGCQ